MKNILQFIPVQITIFLILGILVEFHFNLEIASYLPYIFSFLIVVLVFQYWKANNSFKPNINFNCCIYLIFFFIGISTIHIHNELNNAKHYSHFKAVKNQLVLVVDKKLKAGNYYNKYEAKIEWINNKNTIGKILLNVKKDSSSILNVDERVYLSTELKELQAPLNPYYFSYKEYLKRKNIHHQIFVSNDEILRMENNETTLKGLAAKFRRKINVRLVENGFKGDELAVINALLLGQRQQIASELLQSYTGAGAIHILAVSGLHVGIILLLLNLLLKPIEAIKNGRTIKIVLIVILLWSFALIAGLSASVVRAVTMFTAVTIALQMKRPTNVYNTLVISIFFLLLFNPYFLFDVGFQLSYLAVFSIVWVQPMLYKVWKPKWVIIDYFWKILTVSVAAQFGIIPISLYYFHQFPSLFFVSNLLVIPVLGIILFLGIVVIALSLFNWLPQFLEVGYSYIIQKMNASILWIAAQKDFLFQQISFSIYLVASSYIFILVLIRFLEVRSYKRALVLGMSILVLQTVFILEKWHKNTTEEFIVFHKSRYSMIGIRKGNQFKLVHTLDSASIANDKVINQYRIGVGNLEIEKTDEIPNVLGFKDKRILIIDSLGVYKLPILKPEIVILHQSPKINLDRLLDTIHPKIIIADGSNYKSYIDRWQLTCKQKNTPFHYTGQNGAYILDGKDLPYTVH